MSVYPAQSANLHAVVLAREGTSVLERYCEGADERWEQPEMPGPGSDPVRVLVDAVLSVLNG